MKIAIGPCYSPPHGDQIFADCFAGAQTNFLFCVYSVPCNHVAPLSLFPWDHIMRLGHFPISCVLAFLFIVNHIFLGKNFSCYSRHHVAWQLRQWRWLVVERFLEIQRFPDCTAAGFQEGCTDRCNYALATSNPWPWHFSLFSLPHRQVKNGFWLSHKQRTSP